MKYAIIENGKITRTVVGEMPPGGVEVQVRWAIPDDYPSNFYYSKTSAPSLSVVGEEVFEDWEVFLRPLESVKGMVYALQNKMRKVKQLGSFMLGPAEIVLADREDSLFINGLDVNVPIRYKVKGSMTRVPMGTAEITALKAAHTAHVQLAYDWEETENTAVEAMTTHDELAAYWDTL